MSVLRARSKIPSKFEDNGPGLIDILESERESPPGQKQTTLRDYQIDAVLKTKAFFDDATRRNNMALIVAPTGSGKSGMVALLPYVLKCEKVIVFSPSKVITDQLAISFGNKTQSPIDNTWTRDGCFLKLSGLCASETDLDDLLEHVNVITKSSEVKNMTSTNLVIVNAQKFGGASSLNIVSHENVNVEEEVIVENVKETFKPFDTILVDEAHHYPAPTWKAIAENFKDKKIVFLTATPYRQGKPILGDDQVVTFEIFKKDIEGISIRKCHFREDVFIEPLDKTLSYKQLDDTISSILHDHNEIEPNVKHQAIVLVLGKSDAENVASCLHNATFVTSEDSRGINFKRFNEGRCQTVVVCGMLLEGYDNKSISLCVILRNVRSRIMFQQFIGRCMRLSYPGDQVEAIVLTYTKHKQRKLWDQWENADLAEDGDDPVDE